MLTTHSDIWYNTLVFKFIAMDYLKGGNMGRGHYARYGNVYIKRMYCQHCKQMAFVIDGKMACCGRPANFEGHRVKIMASPRRKRKPLTPKQKETILKRQNNRCFYCGKEFGDVIYNSKRGKVYYLRPCFDHIDPYVHNYNNYKDNFVAVCQICNGIKSDKVFDSVEEVRNYVKERRKAKGYED